MTTTPRRYRHASRVEAGLKPPKAPIKSADHKGEACFHWSATSQTPRATRQKAADTAEKPAKPGIRWYRLWRNPLTDPIIRANISRNIRAYNEARRKYVEAVTPTPAIMAELDRRAFAICRGFQASHFARGYLDIGYSELHFAHGLVVQGRGFGKHCAASGARGNWMFNVCFVMGPGDTVTPEMENSWRIRSDELGVGVDLAKRHGHNDYMNTACPGPSIRETFLRPR